MNDQILSEWRRRVEAIESGYEFLLAYAAQGRQSEKGASPEQNVREYLAGMNDALEGLGDLVVAIFAEQNKAHDFQAFLEAVGRDARHAQGAVRLVLSRSDIGSQLVDNLNASMHLRALLTDLFLIDDAAGVTNQNL